MSPSSHKFLLTAVGSLGDMFPFVGIGATLRQRGFEVELLANAYFEDTARKAGLGFVSTGPRQRYHQALQDPNLWDAKQGLDVIMNTLAPDPLDVFELIMARVEPGRTTVVHHPFALAARLAQEKEGLPCITAVLSTCLFRSNHRVPVMHGQRDMSTMPQFLKSWMWRLADSLLIDPCVGPRLNRARRALGLGSIERIFDEWLFSPTLTIGLFPKWFAPPQPDWPDQVELTGFPLFHSHRPVPDAVHNFLECGKPPVVFTPGSGVLDAQAFFDTAMAACRRLERRGLFLATASDNPIDDDQFLQVPFAPLDEVLEHCQALVHHGGIGTTGAALAAGLPQIVRPTSHDQFDHAALVERCGAGQCLLPNDFAPPALTTALDEVINDRAMAKRCTTYARRINETDGLDATCDLIEATL